MNPDSENFDSLRQLLSLKRHEIPPPGYFDRFSREVTARIKAGERGGEIGASYSWLRRLLGMFDVKPIFAGAFGTAVCAFIVSGIISSEQSPVMGGAVSAVSGNPSVAAIPVSMTSPGLDQQFSTTSNSVAGSLFDHFPLQTEPASQQVLFSGGN
jgi:hypothetical protein